MEEATREDDDFQGFSNSTSSGEETVVLFPDDVAWADSIRVMGEAPREDDVFLGFSNSASPGEETVVLSPEDVAWVDSCLVSSNQSPLEDDHSWNFTTETILDTQVSQPTTFQYDSPGKLSSSSSLPPSFKASSALPSSSSHSNSFSATHETEISNTEYDEILNLKEEVDASGATRIKFRGQEYLVSPYIPEDARGDPDMEALSPVFSVEDLESNADIFRVWDLNGSDTEDEEEEEDELIVKVRKALQQTSLELPLPLATMDAPTATGVGEDVVDELASGLANISLQEPLLD